MTLKLTVALCVAGLTMLAASDVVLAQQKTARECSDEWAANKAAIQASGKSKRVFVAECRGLPAPTASSRQSPALSKDQFASEADAKASCAAEPIVWVNLRSRFFHAADSPRYGTTKQGAYMCEKESVAAGFRAAPKSATRSRPPAA